MQDDHELTEALKKVYHQQDSTKLDLEQLLQESSGQVHTLARMSSKKELLVRKVAALEVQLSALEQDRQGLSEQLTQARSVNETLENSLSEAQRHILQLEITKSQLEIQLQTVTQANELIQGEVKCLRWKLEAERYLMQQERKTMAEQLSQAEQQHDETLKLLETDHEVEVNKLLQALAIAEGVQQSWLLEKKLLLQQLESLQQEVARLKLANTELKEFNAELKKSLEEVECQWRKLMRLHCDQSLPGASGSSFSKPHHTRRLLLGRAARRGGAGAGAAPARKASLFPGRAMESLWRLKRFDAFLKTLEDFRHTVILRYTACPCSTCIKGDSWQTEGVLALRNCTWHPPLRKEELKSISSVCGVGGASPLSTQ
ncbi:centrosome-associated protein CEP250-like [Pezoporus flaviventris]|uniref:centrosome-associated protein CEP250-like n=1 Tax=Pezoporus flaviventris TaxID=889875 RepID=UPI002AB2F898|nr:centrosome-associated protein CEP250-like [Pezoporus flaviventris]